MMKALLFLLLLGLTTGCGVLGGNCDSEGHLKQAAELEARMRCTQSNDIIASHLEGADTLEVLSFPDLVSIKGGLLLQALPNVRELRMPKLKEINSPNGDAKIYIAEMPSLEVIDLGALGKVTNWDVTGATVFLGDNPRLKTLNLSSLATASSVTFVRLNALRQVSLPALVGPTGVRIDSNVLLESVELSANDAAVSGLQVTNNQTLARISGAGAAQLAELTLTQLPLLTDFSLPVTSIGDSSQTSGFVRVEQTGLTAFALNQLTRSPIVEFQKNPALKSISMTSLATISSRLFLQDNGALATVSFPAAQRIGQMEVVQNPMLPDCQIRGLATQVQQRSGHDPNLISRFNLADACTP